MDEKLMQKIIELKSSGKVLDVGCGSGENAVFLASRGFNVDAFDISEQMITQTRVRAFQSNVFVNAFRKDARNFRTEEKYDIVLCLGMTHFLSKEESLNLIKYLKKITSLSGLNAIEVLISENIEEKQMGYFDFEELKKIYEDWEILEYDEYVGLLEEKIFARIIALKTKN